MWLSGSWHDRRGDTRWPADGGGNGEGEGGRKPKKGNGEELSHQTSAGTVDPSAGMESDPLT